MKFNFDMKNPAANYIFLQIKRVVGFCNVNLVVLLSFRLKIA